MSRSNATARPHEVAPTSQTGAAPEGRASPRRTIRFFNTYEPVTSFYRDLLPALASAGIESEVVISSATYRLQRQDLESALGTSASRIRYIPSGVRYADTRIKKIAVVASYAVGAMARSLVQGRRRANFFLTQPPLFSAWGRLLRALRGQPYVCLMMDLYPHVLAASGLMPARLPLYRGLHRLAIYGTRGAHTVFVIGRCMRDRLLAEGIAPQRIVVVHNWADERIVYPVPGERNPLREKLGIGEEFVVLYSGNMGVAHQFSTILAVAERLRHRSDIRFVFMGRGPRRKEVEAAAGRLPNVMLTDLVPEDQMALSQSLGHAHFISLRDEFTGLMVPSKAYSAMAAGRPLLYEGDVRGEIGRMVQEERIGTVVASGDVAALEAALVAMVGDRAACSALGDRALALARGDYGRDAALARYVEALSGLGDG